MAGFANYLQKSLSSAHAEVWALAREHVRGAVVVFLASVAALPVAAWGTDMKHEIWQLFVYGFIGPCLLYAAVFIFYLARVPAKLDAERVEEIRRLRIAQGLPTNDLDPPKRRYAPNSDWIFRAILAMVIGPLLVTIVVLTLRDHAVLNDTANTLGARSRHYSDLQAAAHALRTDDSTSRWLAENRRVLIEGKDKKGGYKAEIAKLKAELKFAENKPPVTITRQVQIVKKVPVVLSGPANTPPSPERIKLVKEVSELYAEGARLRRALDDLGVTDAQIDAGDAAAGAWTFRTASWLQVNLGPAAAEKFMTPVTKTAGYAMPEAGHKPGEVPKFIKILDRLDTSLANLETIMASAGIPFQ